MCHEGWKRHLTITAGGGAIGPGAWRGTLVVTVLRSRFVPPDRA